MKRLKTLREEACLTCEPGRGQKSMSLSLSLPVKRKGWDKAKLHLLDEDGKLKGFFLAGEAAWPVQGVLYKDAKGRQRISLSAVERNNELAVTGLLEGGKLKGAFLLTDGPGKLLRGALTGILPIIIRDDCGRFIKSEILEFNAGALVVILKLWYYERCVKAQYLKSYNPLTGEEVPLENSPVFVLGEDLVIPLSDGGRVVVYDARNPGRNIAEGGDNVRWGELKVITVKDGDCLNPTYYQFKRRTDRLLMPGEPPEINEEPWSGDVPFDPGAPFPVSPYPGGGVGPGGKGMLDGPGAGPPAVAIPEEELQGYPDGTEVQIVFDFETFVCCDGKLIAYIKWGYTIARFVNGGQASAPVVVLTTPSTGDPNSSPNRGRVRCG